MSEELAFIMKLGCGIQSHMSSPSPFSLTPDPTLLYETPAIRTVLFKATYVCEQRQGLTCLLGSVGLGKSTILRALHSRLSARPDFITAFLPSQKHHVTKDVRIERL